MKNISKTKLLEIFNIGSRIERINLARRKFMLQFAMGIILSKNVQFSAIAEHFPSDVELASHIRRMERFFDDYKLDYKQIGILLLCVLPPGRIHISIDRTNWKFGEQNINFLTITAYCKGVGIPLIFELLDKRGNSNTLERQKLLKKLFRIVPSKQISGFTADREFIGKKWCKFLIINKIPFYIRIKSNTIVQIRGINFHAKDLAFSTRKRTIENVQIHGLKLHLATKKIGYEQDKEDQFLLILTNANVQKAISIYRNRWSIEVFFQSIKKRGFNLENTHLKNLEKLKKLFALVCLAFASCFQVGVWKNDTKKPIRIRKNGYKINSFFRYDLDEIRKALLHFHAAPNLANNIFNFLAKRMTENFQLCSTLNFILKL